MVSLSSSPSANRARHKRPQTPPAAHTAEQTSDDDEGQPAKRSRDEREARRTEQQQQRTDDEEEQPQIPATQEIVAQAPTAKISNGESGRGSGHSSGSKGAVPTAKYGGKGCDKAEQLSRTPTQSSNRLTGKQPIVEPAEGEERITPQKSIQSGWSSHTTNCDQVLQSNWEAVAGCPRVHERRKDAGRTEMYERGGTGAAAG